MDNYKHIRESANKAETMPPHQTWNKIEKRLDYDAKLSHKQRRQSRHFFIVGAAVFFIVLGCLFIYQETHRLPALGNGNIASWEELEFESDNYYDVARLHVLNEAYAQAGI